MALPFTLKRILRQKKNYGNSNNFTMQKYNGELKPIKFDKSILLSWE